MPAGLLGAGFQYRDRSPLGLGLTGTVSGLLTGAVGGLLGGPTGWAIVAALGTLLLQGLIADTNTTHAPAGRDLALLRVRPFWSWSLAGVLAGAASGRLGHEVTVQAEQTQPPPLHVLGNVTLVGLRGSGNGSLGGTMFAPIPLCCSCRAALPGARAAGPSSPRGKPRATDQTRATP